VVTGSIVGEPRGAGTWKTPIFSAGFCFWKKPSSKERPGNMAALQEVNRICASG